MFGSTHQVILKVTRGCNLACKYCYVLNKPEYNNEEMSDEVFDFAIRRWFGETHHTKVDLVFHGGEPLRIGKEKFSRFCTKASQYAYEYDKELTLGIQTNATLIDEEWAAIFHYHNISVGISWDGINPDVDYRNNTHELVLSKLKLLKEYGIQAGALMVLQKGNRFHLAESFNALQNIGVDSIKVNRGVDIMNKSSTDSEFEMNSKELIQSFDDTVNYMIMHPDFYESSVAETIQKWTALKNPNGDIGIKRPGNEDAHCYTRYCGGMKNLMEFEPDGTYQFCGRQSIRNVGLVGTIFDRDFLELDLIRKQWKYNEPKLASINAYRCNECYAQSICDGGCISYSDQKLGKPIIDPGTHHYFKALGLYLIRNAAKINKLAERLQQDEMNNDPNRFDDQDPNQYQYQHQNQYNEGNTENECSTNQRVR